MTRPTPSIPPNPASTHTVSSLQIPAAMRHNRRPALSLRALVATLGLLLAAPPSARAQDNSCNGDGKSAPSKATFTLAVQETSSSTSYTTVGPMAVPYILNLAECQCDSRDLFLRGFVNVGYATGNTPMFGVWSGNACNTTTQARSNSCEQLVEDAVSVETFLQGTNQGAPIQRVPVLSVVSPITTNSSTQMCPSGAVNNGIWFLFGDSTSAVNCNVALNYDGSPPDPPRNPRVGSGDEAVTISWDLPAAGTGNAAAHYQVLCAEAGGAAPGPGAFAFGEAQGNGKFKLGYTTCVDQANHVVQRQVVATNSSASGDGGTASVDMASAVGPGEPLGTQSDPVAADEPLTTQADPVDGGVVECPTNDGGVPEVFKTLDKKYVCSDVLSSSATTARVTGLKNSTTYLFTVVALDASGNAQASATICAKPQPVEDLWRRYLAEGGKQQGFCFIATAAYGSYQHPYVMVLRDFRDRVLLPTSAGAAFVDWYYRVSPPLADWIRPRPWARFMVRGALWPVIGAAGMWMWLEAGEWLAIAVLTLALLWYRRARRRARLQGTQGMDGAEGAPGGPHGIGGATHVLAPAGNRA